MLSLRIKKETPTIAHALLSFVFMHRAATTMPRQKEQHQQDHQQRQQQRAMTQQEHQEQKQQQHRSLILPVEILQAIGAFLDPIALHRACRVNRFWCHCLRPGLWRDIPGKALVSRTFIDQFAHYAHHILHLTLTVPNDPDQIQALANLRLTRDPSRISASSPPKTLLDCTNLESAEIDLRSSYSRGVQTAAYSINLSPISTLLEHYARRLRKVALVGLREHHNNLLLQAVQGMPQLNNLSLVQWEFPDLDILYDILLNCQRLRTLALEIDDGIAVSQLRRLKDWRFRYDSTLKSLAEDGTATGEDDGHINDPSCFRLSGVQKLILDQSVVNIDLVMLLCGVMPDLLSLSMKDTDGLVESVSFFDDPEDLVDVQTVQAEEMAEPTADADFADLFVYSTDDDEDDGSDDDDGHGDYYGEDGPNVADEESDEEEQEAEEEEIEDPGNEGTESEGIAPINILTGAPYSDNDEDGDHGDFDNRHRYSFSDYDDDYDDDYDEYDYLYDDDTNIADQDDVSVRALYALRQACPRLKHFDFSGCSLEMNQDFFIHLLKIWGENLEGLLVRETCLFSEAMFDVVGNLGKNLVHLDLSFKGSTRFGKISRSIYYDRAISIFESCQLLETLFIAPYVIDAKEIANCDIIPWRCVKLRHLSLCVEYKQDPDIDTDQGRHQESARIQRTVYRQLARLSRLETFVIQGGCDTTHRAAAHQTRGRPMGDRIAGSCRDRCLEFRLEFGLDELSTWKCLKLLDMSGLETHGMEENDLAWIAREWPALERIEGFYPASELEAIAKSQRREVDEATMAKMRKAETILDKSMSSGENGLHSMNRADLIEKCQCRVPLSPEAVICASGRLKSLENSRQAVIVDEFALERTFAMHDLKIFDHPLPSNPPPPPLHVTGADPWTLKEISDKLSHPPRSKGKEKIVDQACEPGEQDRSHEPTFHPIKQYVGYSRIPLSTAEEHSLKRRPGGIANDELMANVMRPRQDGRSPSPLGTWY